MFALGIAQHCVPRTCPTGSYLGTVNSWGEVGLLQFIKVWPTRGRPAAGAALSSRLLTNPHYNSIYANMPKLYMSHEVWKLYQICMLFQKTAFPLLSGIPNRDWFHTRVIRSQKYTWANLCHIIQRRLEVTGPWCNIFNCFMTSHRQRIRQQKIGQWRQVVAYYGRTKG